MKRSEPPKDPPTRMAAHSENRAGSRAAIASLRALAAAVVVAAALATLLFWPARAAFSGYRPVLDPARSDAPGPNLGVPHQEPAASGEVPAEQ
jgi:hypothetical protein